MLGCTAVAAEPNGLLAGGGTTVAGAGIDATGAVVGGSVTMGALPGGKLVGVRSFVQSEGVHPIVMFSRL